MGCLVQEGVVEFCWEQGKAVGGWLLMSQGAEGDRWWLAWLAVEAGDATSSWHEESEGQNGRLLCLLCLDYSMPILISFFFLHIWAKFSLSESGFY